jgi:octaprenyl-diphosphate synthase
LQQSRERGNLELSEAEYLGIIDGKTAELTACCCRLGALYSAASPAQVESLARYGRSLGLAFQIADDLLDLLGDERTTGKSLGTDLQQQKLTLPLIHLLQQPPGEAPARLRQILASPGNHKREALTPFLAAGRAIDYARGRAEDYAGRAREELICLPRSPYRELLETLTYQVVRRDA